MIARGGMWRLRARGGTSSSAPGRPRVTVRAHYGALPFAAGRGEDEGGESRPDQGSSFSPHPHPEVRSRGQKSPRRSVERRFAAIALVATRSRPRTSTQRRVFRRSSSLSSLRGSTRFDNIAERASAFLRGEAITRAPQRTCSQERRQHAKSETREDEKDDERDSERELRRAGGVSRHLRGDARVSSVRHRR